MSLREELLGQAGDNRPPPRTVGSQEAWVAAAENRPEWLIWGKARPRDDCACPAHPLLCHMLDVAAVAGVLLTERLSPAGARRLLSIAKREDDALGVLLYAIALHDIGKISPSFQAQVPWAREALTRVGFDAQREDGVRHHGELGFRWACEQIAAAGVKARLAQSLARAVTAHHGEFPTNDSYRKAPGPRERGEQPLWQHARQAIARELRALFPFATETVAAVDHAWVAEFAGLCAISDWIGSMDDAFEYVAPQSSAKEYWAVAVRRARIALDRAGMRAPAVRDDTARSFGELFDGLAPWPLHVAVAREAEAITEPTLFVVEAPMGEGKTEAALLLADHVERRLGARGMFFGLPTQATANQLFGRILRFLERTRPAQRSNLVLTHGEADFNDLFRSIAGVYDKDATRTGPVRADRWFLNKKRALLAEFGVGTIDQALFSVLRVMHGFVRLFALSGRTVVLDEVHAYDAFTSEILDRLLEWLGAMGSSVVLLSATLPSKRRSELLRAYRSGAGASDAQLAEPIAAANYPRITSATRSNARSSPFDPRGKPTSVSIATTSAEPEEIAGLLRELARDGGCIGCVCNTVARAQAVYRALGAINDCDRLLLHARLLPGSRSQRENTLVRWLGPQREDTSRPARCIVVGTQVLEQSLDVDFDALVSDLAPIDLLLQRAGRLHRHLRDNRSASQQSARLFIARNDGTDEQTKLRDVAGVYDEAVLRQTLRALRNRAKIELPTDIESLVESVYSAELPAPDDTLYKQWIERFGVEIGAKQDALGRVIPSPSHPIDPFGDLQVHFGDDDDPTIHEHLRAITRSGPPSVELVCVVRDEGRDYVDEARTQPLDLDAKPDRELARKLVARSIGISNQQLVRALVSKTKGASSPYQPAAWAEHPILMFRRLVAFERGVAMVGDLRLELDPELGLCISRA